MAIRTGLQILALILASWSVPASAGGGIVNLGRATDTLSTNPYFPLSGFRPMRQEPRPHGLPEVVFISTQPDAASAMERWPVVKALDQFGRLSRVAHAQSGPAFLTSSGPLPTFDLSRATYGSKYIQFAHTDLLNRSGRYFQKLSAEGRALYDRYSRARTGTGQDDPDHVIATLESPPTSSRKLPLIAVGGYVQTVSQIMVEGDFVHSAPLQPGNPAAGATRSSPLSFSTVHGALVRGRDPSGTRLVEDVNAEANIITALICHADGLRPRNVCGRAAIRGILKHVR